MQSQTITKESQKNQHNNICSGELRTLIPTAKSLLEPEIPKDIDRKLLAQRSKQTCYYNRGSKELL